MDLSQILPKIWEITTVYGLKIIAAVVILVLGRWISKVISNIVRRIMRKTDVDPTIISFTANLSYVALLVFVVLAALSQLQNFLINFF